MIRVSTDPIDVASALAAFEKEAGDAGATVSFSGKVRGRAENSSVTSLVLEHYPGVTEASIREIADEALGRWPLQGFLIQHRVGEIFPGETIVLVCTASAHRRAAFEAADFMMDYLKSRALFWKKERRDGEEVWIEPRDEDYQDAKRWAQEEDHQ